MTTGILLISIIMIFGVCLVGVISKLLFLCQPNEVLIFSGRPRVVGNRRIGYRLIKGGRGVKLPLVEVVDKLDLTTMSVDVNIKNAYSKGGIPLCIQGVANVKIAGAEPLINNALERILGLSRSHIMRVAKDTLEGNLRGVLATLTPEQVNEDKISFAQSLMEEAEPDLNKLGILLDNLKVQNVFDEVGYLDSIGRKKSSEVHRDARIAEARTKAESTVKAADNIEKTEVARIEANIAIAEADNERKLIDAKSKKEAFVAESKAVTETAIVKAKAEIELQKARVEQVRGQLEADLIRPAHAAMEEARSRAKGESAKIIEDGVATVNVLEEITKLWQEAGQNAKDVVVMQKLDVLMNHILSTLKSLKVKKLTMIGGSNDGSQNSMPVELTTFLESISAVVNSDVRELIKEKLDSFMTGEKLINKPQPPPIN